MPPPSQPYDLVVWGGTCITPAGRVTVDIGIRGDRVAALGELAGVEARETLAARGLTVLPGVIDTHVHFREPGGEHKEDIESGSRAAVLGGVVAAFEMPNTNPATSSASALQDKLQRAAGRAWCDYAFYVGATPANAEELPELESLPGCCGIKLFMGSSTGDLLVSDDSDILRVLQHGVRRVAVHSEDEARLVERKSLLGKAPQAAMHPLWRDVQAAFQATRRLIRLARKAGRRVHVLHVTTAEEIALLAEHKDIATAEVTPQHLTLAAPDCYQRLGTLAQMNPPIREKRHQEDLWRGISDGVVDTIGSDHAPHTREEKARPYPHSPSGMPGVQTLLPVLLHHVNAGRLTVERLVDLTSAGPARVFGMAGKGRVAVGYDADLTLVDLRAKHTIADEWIASHAGWTPFHGLEVAGWPVATVIRGQLVMRDGQLLDKPAGRPVRFQETLTARDDG